MRQRIVRGISPFSWVVTTQKFYIHIHSRFHFKFIKKKYTLYLYSFVLFSLDCDYDIGMSYEAIKNSMSKVLY